VLTPWKSFGQCQSAQSQAMTCCRCRNPVLSLGFTSWGYMVPVSLRARELFQPILSARINAVYTSKPKVKKNRLLKSVSSNISILEKFIF